MSKAINNGYVEVSPTSISSSRWREVILDTGSSQSTLQDFKLPESSGGYTYKDSNGFVNATCNRFIYWKCSNDILELTELSMDVNLTGNQLRVRFQNSPVLEGISVHETMDMLFILVATVGSVHRLAFPHPKKLSTVSPFSISQSKSQQQQQQQTSSFRTSPRADQHHQYSSHHHLSTRPSIFSPAYSENLHDPANFSVLNSTMSSMGIGSSSIGTTMPITSCSWLTSQRDAMFVIANSGGSLVVVKLDSMGSQGKAITFELKQTTLMGRIFHGLVPSIIRGNQEGDEAAVSLCSHALTDDHLIFALCRDLRIRVWSQKRKECLIDHYVLQTASMNDNLTNSSSFTQSMNSALSKSLSTPISVRRPVILRKWTSRDGTKVLFGAFISGTELRQFILFELVTLNPGQFKLRTVATINAPESDLVDFTFYDDQIWSLWLSSDNSLTVMQCPYQSLSSWYWKKVALHSQFTPKINVNSLLVDPRELYTEEIFWSGKFSLQTIGKAISIFSRISDVSLMGMKIEQLIEKATHFVERTIRSQVSSSEISVEEYQSIVLQAWEKLYLYCIQYDQHGNKPLGLFIDERTGLIGVVKRSNISLLRRCDEIDEAIINCNQLVPPIDSSSSSSTSVSSSFDTSISNAVKMPTSFPSIEDVSLIGSVKTLLKCVNVISQSLTEDDLISFESALARGEPAEQAASRIVEESLLSAINPFSLNRDPLKHAFNSVFIKEPRLIEAIEAVLESLQTDLVLREEENQVISSTPLASTSTSYQPLMNTLSQLMSSNNGVAFLTESMRQVARIRFNFSRDLLIFQKFITLLRNKNSNAARTATEKMHSIMIPATSRILQSYYIMSWICDTPMTMGSVFTSQDIAAHLSILELNEYINVNRTSPSSSSLLFDFAPRTILSYLIQHHGGVLAKKLLSHRLSQLEEDISDLRIWTQIVPMFVSCISQVISPLGLHFHLPEFLFGFGQYLLLERYVSLLSLHPSYDWNVSSRHFMKGLSYLVTGEPDKAVLLFNRVACLRNFQNEHFLSKFVGVNHLILNQDMNEDQAHDDLDSSAETSASPEVIYRYYNKLIQLFNLYSHPHALIELIKNAITLLDKSKDKDFDQHLSSLQSTLFVSHLELGNTIEAYKAMILNPDENQKKICLRQLIVDHCERAKLGDLIQFTYVDLNDEFVDILESRARATDLLLSGGSDCDSTNKNNYYHILYAYFVKDNNFRRAASVMYEYYRRLKNEVPGLESIIEQVNCLLITLNCLRIVNPNYSWIVKPTSKRLPSTPLKDKSEHEEANKRNRNGNEIAMDQTVMSSNLDEMNQMKTHGIEVLDSDDVQKEYELIKARLRLLEKDSKNNEMAISVLSPQETVTLLITASMFDHAFFLSSLMSLPYQPIFEGIVSKYIYIMQSGINYEVVDIYDCFIENDTASLGYINTANLSPVEKMWHLIVAYLEKYELKGQTGLYRCVTEKLLSSGLPLPSLLKLKYQKLNCPELILLLMTWDCIEDAVSLSIEYIHAFMGRGTDYFDIQSPLLPNSPPIYVPHQHFGELMNILKKEDKLNSKFKPLHQKLSKELLKLKEEITIVSKQAFS